MELEILSKVKDYCVHIKFGFRILDNCIKFHGTIGRFQNEESRFVIFWKMHRQKISVANILPKWIYQFIIDLNWTVFEFLWSLFHCWSKYVFFLFVQHSKDKQFFFFLNINLVHVRNTISKRKISFYDKNKLNRNCSINLAGMDTFVFSLFKNVKMLT